MNHAVSVEFRPKDPPLGAGTMKTLTNIQLKLPDPVVIPAADAIRQVGFADDEALLPASKRSFKVIVCCPNILHSLQVPLFRHFGG